MAGTPELYLGTAVQYSAPRTGTVSWVVPWRVPDIDATDLPNALMEAQSVLPDWGDPVPAPLSGLFVDQVNYERFTVQATGGKRQMFGTLVYRSATRDGSFSTPDDNGPGRFVASSATAVETETETDVGDVPITTSYDNVTQQHAARTFELLHTKTWQRTEVSDPGAPGGRSEQYTGRLNSGLWNGYAARTVLMVSIDGRSQDGTNSWVVEYTWQYRPAGWKHTAIHEDPMFPGNPLPIAVEDTRVEYDTIPTANFSALGINL